MSRSIIMAILAFGLLIITNLAIFAHLSFDKLSETMVTEKLIAGLEEAKSMVRQQGGQASSVDSRGVTKRLAPRLQKFVFIHAVVLIDRQGRVLHRELIRSRFVVSQEPRRANPRPLPAGNRLVIPVQSGGDIYPGDTQLALEYNAAKIEEEVRALRRELNRKLGLAIVISILLLGAGLAYVILAYKRNKLLQNQARKADRMAYVGTLASGLAHEIRNPLNSMNMNVQLIQEELEEQNTRDFGDMTSMLEGTRREIMRLERLVSSFLAFARPTQLHYAHCQVNEVLSETLEFLEPEILKSGIDLRTQFDPKLPKIQADENQLRQAVLNVVQNAIQVLQPKRLLEVSTRGESGGQVAIRVRDEGPGISAPELQNIFKVFYSTRKGGTGLGLPIAMRIAELHHGDIRVESEVGKGTTFTFLLPCRAPAA